MVDILQNMNTSKKSHHIPSRYTVFICKYHFHNAGRKHIKEVYTSKNFSNYMLKKIHKEFLLTVPENLKACPSQKLQTEMRIY